jgi:hypothetical protein
MAVSLACWAAVSCSVPRSTDTATVNARADAAMAAAFAARRTRSGWVTAVPGSPWPGWPAACRAGTGSPPCGPTVITEGRSPAAAQLRAARFLRR